MKAEEIIAIAISPATFAKLSSSDYKNIIAAIEEVCRERDAKQVNHEYACNVFDSGPCTCGFSSLREKLALAEQQAKRLTCLHSTFHADCPQCHIGRETRRANHAEAECARLRQMLWLRHGGSKLKDR